MQDYWQKEGAIDVWMKFYERSQNRAELEKVIVFFCSKSIQIHDFRSFSVSLTTRKFLILYNETCDYVVIGTRFSVSLNKC